MRLDADVVVVGLGPVGATAANLAHDLGLHVIALDRSTRVVGRPRAIGFDHEAMRVFANLGLADAIADHVMPYRPSEYHNSGGQVIKHVGTAPPPHLLGWTPNYVFRQPQLEGALRQRLESHTPRSARWRSASGIGQAVRSLPSPSRYRRRGERHPPARIRRAAVRFHST